MSIVSESGLDHADIQKRMSQPERDEATGFSGESKLSKVFESVVMVSTAVFLLALYFCSMKLTTMISQISMFEIMYHRSLWGLLLLTCYQSFIRKGDPIKTSFFAGISREQFPYVMIRVVGTTLAHLLIFMALRLTSTSKVILIFENPFLTSVMAFFIIGEKITKHEVVVFCLATIGIVLISRTNKKADAKKDVSDELIGVVLCLIAAVLANLSTLALRQMQLKNNPVDPFIVSTIVCIFGCLLNPLLIVAQDQMGSYKPVEYTNELKLALASVAFFYVLAQVYVSQLYYLLKASWARVALNMQVIVTFFFDVFVADVSFSSVELAGCGLLLAANFYLFFSQLFTEDEQKSKQVEESPREGNQQLSQLETQASGR